MTFSDRSARKEVKLLEMPLGGLPFALALTMMLIPLRPQAVAFDVIGTLFSLEPLRSKMQGLGLTSGALELWYATMLRDALTLTLTENYAPLEKLGQGTLEELIAETGRPTEKSEVQEVLGTMKMLPAYPDVRPAFEILQAAGVAIVMLSNGAAAQTKALLQGAGLETLVTHIVSTDDVQRFKPHQAVYEHAAQVAGVEPARLALVAAHGWDVHGANRVGLVTGWVKRQEKRLPATMQGPNVGGETLDEVVKNLLALPVQS